MVSPSDHYLNIGPIISSYVSVSYKMGQAEVRGDSEEVTKGILKFRDATIFLVGFGPASGVIAVTFIISTGCLGERCTWKLVRQ